MIATETAISVFMNAMKHLLTLHYNNILTIVNDFNESVANKRKHPKSIILQLYLLFFVQKYQ